MTGAREADPPLILRAAVPPSETRRPRMANDEDVRPGLELTSRSLVRDGRGWLPVSGEMHYSRVPRDRWEERLRQMVAGGVTVVASYVPWLHHAPDGPRARFDDGLDIAAFVDLARAAGLEVVLRIGPWVHAEMRNGGFPDWVQQAPVAHRTDDPAYLALVRGWWEQLAAALGGRCAPETVLGIQIENELYDQPGHLVTLKGLARSCGMTAPLWTATAWGGAQLPEEELFPLYGGYADGFWVDPGAPWHPTFREHFFFSHTWDDPGIGADVREGEAGTARTALSPWFPPATCELGGGMATAFHRRPWPSGRDVAAVGHVKVGNGSAWQGFFMYVGGTNPGRDLQETQATGYPNDMPVLSYDFHAPVGEAGRLGDGHAELRTQNAFLAAFGPDLVDMDSALPDAMPGGVEDSETLRWAYRGGADGGFLFVAWHQPHVPLATFRGASFRIETGAGAITLPSAPVDIPAGTLARWPVRLTVGGARIQWLTASALTVVGGEVPTLFAIAEPGIPVELALPDGARVAGASAAPASADGTWRVSPSRDAVRVSGSEGALDLVVLPAEDASRVWIPLAGDGRARRVLLSDDELTWDADARVTVRSTTDAPDVRAWARGGFATVTLAHGGGAAETAEVATELRRGEVGGRPDGYGERDGRPSAPGLGIIEAHARIVRLDIPATAADPDACLEISWAGDVADLRVDGAIVADRFWDGSLWRVNCRDAGIRPGADVELRILPLAKSSTVHVPEAAQERRDSAPGDLVALDAVRLTRRATWVETGDA